MSLCLCLYVCILCVCCCCCCCCCRFTVSTLQQRLSHPSSQGLYISSLLPRRKALITKLSSRCSSCNCFLIKHGPSASNPKFEINTCAINFLPTITVGEYPPLQVGKTIRLILFFTNTQESKLNISLAQIDMREISKQRRKLWKLTKQSGRKLSQAEQTDKSSDIASKLENDSSSDEDEEDDADAEENIIIPFTVGTSNPYLPPTLNNTSAPASSTSTSSSSPSSSTTLPAAFTVLQPSDHNVSLSFVENEKTTLDEFDDMSDTNNTTSTTTTNNNTNTDTSAASDNQTESLIPFVVFKNLNKVGVSDKQTNKE